MYVHVYMCTCVHVCVCVCVCVCMYVCMYVRTTYKIRAETVEELN